jgi:hypothetical protein
VKELECSKQPYRNGTTVLGNLTLLLGVPHDADREARIRLTPSIKAAALDPVRARLTVFSAWVRWEALPIGEAMLVELPEVHEPLFVVVVVPVVARLPARWANRTLDNSITIENERIGTESRRAFNDESSQKCWRQLAERRDAGLAEVLCKLAEAATVIADRDFFKSAFLPQILNEPWNCGFERI